jgi:hypothetical protein
VAKDESCGQTPQQEESLKGLGWTDMDIDKMSARQIDIILKKKTKRRVKADVESEVGRPSDTSVPNPLTAGNTPEQIRNLLKKLGLNADELYGFLKERDYTKYNVGDFYKGDLPKLRKLGELLVKKKKELEVAVFKYRSQLMKDLKEAHKAATASVEGAEGGWQEVKVKGKTYRWKKNDLFKKNPRTQAALDIQYENPKVGWRDVKNLQTRTEVFKAAKL